MKRLEVVYREDASLSFEAIASFIIINGASIETAERFIARIKARCERIGDVPLGGRPRDDLSPGLRTVPFEDSAVIAYIVLEDRVEIVDIFYGGRDYEALYHEPDPPPG